MSFNKLNSVDWKQYETLSCLHASGKKILEHIQMGEAFDEDEVDRFGELLGQLGTIIDSLRIPYIKGVGGA